MNEEALMDTEDTDITEAQQVAAEKAIRGLMTNCTGTTGALLATDDGYVVSQVITSGDVSGKTLAAVSASLLGLAESLAATSEQGLCQNVIVENDDGIAVCLRVGVEYVLIALADKDTRLGMLLSAAKGCAESLARALGTTGQHA